MTKQECKDLMLEMWWWLYENPNKDKENFVKSHPDYPQHSQEYCAACDYSLGLCKSCPLDWWGQPRCTRTHQNRGLTPFTRWALSNGSRSRKFGALEMVKMILRMKV